MTNQIMQKYELATPWGKLLIRTYIDFLIHLTKKGVCLDGY